ncbi:uncharacterized protein LOC110114082 [Dendrobium catenatum]|uniref:Uncharacterized protein n=1 Tax=Dendrobium catenatum TaxID=906689 RepID=A0A2I0VUB6_9ASPA|nr:uncharacterized protein LOC110114082 [Dendrobium catenatum]PKU67012.1 hypothetical protein MA16_Dca018752 [Dendrobium catenatum]
MSTSVVFLLLTLAISFLLRPSSTSAAKAEEDLMRQLWRSELARLAGYGEERLSSVLVTGSLLYQDRHFSSGSNHLTTSYAKGVKVAVTCKNDEGRMKRSDFSYGTTDEFGDFIINIPSHLHAIPNFEDSCFVKILKTQRNSQYYYQISISNPMHIKLSHVGNNIRVYTTGTVRISLRG